MKFVCEHCKKVHSTLPEAEACEKSHEAEILARETMLAKEEEINQRIHEFCEEYGRCPKLRLCLNPKSFYSEIGESYPDRLFKILFGRD